MTPEAVDRVNRADSQHPTGFKTEVGKHRASLTAIRRLTSVTPAAVYFTVQIDCQVRE